jgi:hypothetical protein
VTYEEAKSLARIYRRFLLLVGLQCTPIAFLLAREVPPSPLLGTILLGLLVGFVVAFFLTPHTGRQLLAKLEVDAPGRSSVLMHWPIFSLFSLRAIAGYARRWGRRRGVEMGIAGPTREALDSLLSTHGRP